jgi:predicted dehydrogenase
MKQYKILVTAAGSIGERHIRNLWHLGYRDITVFRTRNLPFRDLGAARVNVVLDWTEALRSGAEVAFITSPTHLHARQFMDCLQAGMHVFVEKPITHNLNDEQKIEQAIEQSNRVVQVGYMLEFHPLLLAMKEICATQKFGPLLFAESYWGDYLPNWHPWEDYRESYAAKEAMGGGVALTLSHELNTILWLINKVPSSFSVVKNSLKSIETEAENLVEIILNFGSDTSARVHMNYVEKLPKRYTSVLFENGRLSFRYLDNELRIEDFNAGSESVQRCPGFNRNDMFIRETQHFFGRIKSGDTGLNTDLRRALEVVKICTQ